MMRRSTIQLACFVRRGTTLLEVAIGSAMMALLIVPGLHLLSESESLQRRHRIRARLLFLAEEAMEQQKILLTQTSYFQTAWARGVDEVTPINSPGVPDLLARNRISADASVGIAPARLVTVTVEVWQDVNRNRRLDQGELSEVTQTQWASR